MSDSEERVWSEDPEVCDQCGTPSDDGEGYDGLCGACAEHVMEKLSRRGMNATWVRFWFDSNQFFAWVEGPDDWNRLREAHPDLSDAELLAVREATFRGQRSEEERKKRPNFGMYKEHDGEKRLRDFFVEQGMKLPDAQPVRG